MGWPVGSLMDGGWPGHRPIGVPSPPPDITSSCDATAEKRSERTEGIEPSFPAWKASALPLSYIRMAPREWNRTIRLDGKLPSALPLSYRDTGTDTLVLTAINATLKVR